MDIYPLGSNIDSFDLSLKGYSAISIGNFDGCHLGHQKLMLKIMEKPTHIDEIATVMTFSPHPSLFFKKKKSNSFLFTEKQKIRAFREFGVQRVINIEFDKNFTNINHDKFYDHLLLKTLLAKTIVIGSDFRFGLNRKGDSEYLKTRANGSNCPEVIIIPPEKLSGTAISSSRIRKALESDNTIESVTSMLGRPYLLEGEIIPGKKLGRTIGVPTANLGNIEQLVPKKGVYYGYIWIGERDSSLGSSMPPIYSMPIQKIPAVINIGTNPTFNPDESQIKVEAHGLNGNWAEDSYGKPMGIYFLGRIRDELRFAGKEELKSQITKDIEYAKKKF